MSSVTTKVFGLLMFVGAAVIAASSTVYFGDDIAPFVIEKLPLPLEDVWLFALQTHVIAAVCSLPSCVILHSSTLVRRAPTAHRWLGRTTAMVVLFALVPSGLYLSLFAKGGVLGTLGFVLSGLITVFAMVGGVQHARARRYVAHRKYTRHVLAQLSVAITSRVLLLMLEAAAVEAELAYLIALWGPVVASAAFVEWASFTPKQRKSHAASHSLVPDRISARARG